MPKLGPRLLEISEPVELRIMACADAIDNQSTHPNPTHFSGRAAYTRLMVVEQTVNVVARRVVGPGMVALELESPAGFEAQPGQFVLVRSRGRGGRHFTISSLDVADTFEITIEVTSDGQLSPWLAKRTPGDTVHIEGPFGRTYFDGGAAVAMGSGSGIGAAVGVAERAIRDGEEASVVAASPLAHEARLAALAAGGATVFVVSNGLDDAVAATAGSAPVYVFGFRGFIDRVRTALAEGGYDPDAPSYESYGHR